MFEDGGDAEFFQNCKNGSRRSARSCSLTQYSLFVVKMFSLAVKQLKSTKLTQLPKMQSGPNANEEGETKPKQPSCISKGNSYIRMLHQKGEMKLRSTHILEGFITRKFTKN